MWIFCCLFFVLAVFGENPYIEDFPYKLIIERKSVSIGSFRGEEICYCGGIALYFLNSSVDQSEHPMWISAFPSYVNKSAYPYQLMAFALFENDVDRLKKGYKILKFIAEKNPQTHVPDGVDWPDYFQYACAMSTMPYEQKVIPSSDPAKFPTQNNAPPPKQPEIYYGRFDGVFPGFRHLTYGTLAKEAVERIKSRRKDIQWDEK